MNLRIITRILAVLLMAAGILALCVWLSAHVTVQASPRPCPVRTCLKNVLITDGAVGMNAPFTIEDNEGYPAGQNAVMFFVNGFQVGSVNPVCADATKPYLAWEACLGGPPFAATGGHPVLSLSPDNGKTWVVLTIRDIRFIHMLERSRIIPAGR